MADIPLSKAAEHFGAMPEKIAKAAHRGLVLAANRSVAQIVTVIIPSRSPQPVDRGVFRAGWRYEERAQGRVFILNLEPHAAHIEHGVRGENVKIGRAMIQALSEWAIRKGIVGSEKEAKAFAWATAMSMKNRGIFNRNGRKGLGILAELMEKYAAKFVQEEVTREIRKELANG